MFFNSRLMPIICLLFIALFALTGVDPAIAQSMSSDDALAQVSGKVSSLATSSDDLSAQWLRRLFPGAASVWGGTDSDTDVWIPLFTIFNAIIAIVGAGMLTWHTLSGIVNTASSGKILGAQWNTVWAPVRVVTGVALVVPIKGYCLAQLIVILMLSWGYGMANTIWSVYVDATIGNSSTTVSAPVFDTSQTSVSQFLQAETCMNVIRAYQKEADDAIFFAGWRYANTAQYVPEGGLDYDGVKKNGFYEWDYGAVCGKFSLTITDTDKWLGKTNNPSWSPTSDAETAAVKTFDEKKKAAFVSFIKKVKDLKIAEEFSYAVSVGENAPSQTSMTPKMKAALDAAATYNSEVTSAAKEVSTAFDEGRRRSFIEMAETMGWASAGSANLTLVRLAAAAVERAQSAKPHFSGTEFDRVNDSEVLLKRLNEAQKDLRLFVRDSQRELEAENPLDIQIGEDRQTMIEGGGAFPFFKWAMDRVAVGVSDLFALDTLYPLGGIMSLGQKSLVAGEALALGLWTATATSAGLEKGAENGVWNITAAMFAFTKTFLQSASGVLLPVAIGLIVMGCIHAYVLPMVIYIMWMFAVVACITYAIELVIAAPIAAFQHIRMDGQDLISDKQRPIYGMVFNAVLRPTLLLFGLISSSVAFSIMAGFVNRTFAVAMLSSQGNTTIGAFGIFTMLILLVYIHYQLAVRSMALVHQVPSMVARILHVEDASRGEEGNTTQMYGAIANFTRVGATSAVSNTVTARSGATGGSGGGMAGMTGADGGGAGGGNGGVSLDKIGPKSSGNKADRQ